MLSPRESGQFIAKESKHVKIIDSALIPLADHIVEATKSTSWGTKRWKTHPLNPDCADENAANWIFVADLLNFSFWSKDPQCKYTVTYKGVGYTGYWSLCAAMNRALDEGIPFITPSYYKSIKFEEFEKVFRSDTEIPVPMLKERFEILRQAGTTLVEKFDSNFVNCIKQCEQNSSKLLKLLLDNFPSLRDEADYKGKWVTFYKRAQILIADLWSCFEDEGYGKFTDIDSITMFADYRIPQTLAFFGLLEYSAELKDLLSKDHMFSSGDEMEVELRGCSIWATELLTKCVKERLVTAGGDKNIELNTILVDHYLWDYRRQYDDKTKHIPFHKIRCVFY